MKLNRALLPMLTLAAMAASYPAFAQQATPDDKARMQQQMQMMSVMFDLRPTRLGHSETLSALIAAARKITGR